MQHFLIVLWLNLLQYPPKWASSVPGEHYIRNIKYHHNPKTPSLGSCALRHWKWKTEYGTLGPFSVRVCNCESFGENKCISSHCSSAPLFWATDFIPLLPSNQSSLLFWSWKTITFSHFVFVFLQLFDGIECEFPMFFIYMMIDGESYSPLRLFLLWYLKEAIGKTEDRVEHLMRNVLFRNFLIAWTAVPKGLNEGLL